MKSLLLLFLMPLNSFAGQLPKYCYGHDVYEIERPLTTLSPTAESFTYRYRMFRAAKSGNPVVILIPGGPGQTSMKGDNAVSFVPLDWGVVLTDPRGVGCNSSPEKEMPYEAFSALQIASDINALIQTLNPSSVYLYGTSFGTVVASLVSDIRKMQNQVPLAGLVLEGTVGKYFSSQEYEAQFVRQWHKYLSTRLSPESKAVLEQVQWPFSIDRTSFAGFINVNLVVGGFQSKGHQLDVSMSMIATPEGRVELEKHILMPTPPESAPPLAKLNAQKLWAKIWCEEMTVDGDRWQNTLVGSDMTIIPSSGQVATRCRGLNFKQGYDSAKLTIREKIFYFQGEDDPATGLSSAIYHFNAENSSNKKVFLKFPNMGHAPFRMVIAFGADGPAIWKAIDHQGSVVDIIEKKGFLVEETVRLAP